MKRKTNEIKQKQEQKWVGSIEKPPPYQVIYERSIRCDQKWFDQVGPLILCDHDYVTINDLIEKKSI